MPVHEIIAGEQFITAAASLRDLIAKTAIVAALSRNASDWVIAIDPELHLAGHVLIADIAAWRRDRAPAVDQMVIDVVPDFVCEVQSFVSESLDRHTKLPLYGQLGVKHAWLLTPIYRMLEVWERREPYWTYVAAHGDDERVRAVPFDACELDLGSLWVADEGAAVMATPPSPQSSR